MSLKYKHSAYTLAEWETLNPVIVKDEIVVESDTNRLKIGDGIKTYTELGYINNSIKKLIGKNDILSEVMIHENITYVIEHNFDLTDISPLTVPNNSILEFAGGKLSNGVLYSPNLKTFKITGTPLLDNIQINGNISNTEIELNWFGSIQTLVFDGETRLDITPLLKAASTTFIGSNNLYYGNILLKIPYGVYWLTETIFIKDNLSVDANSALISPTFNGTMFAFNCSTVGGDWLMNGANFVSHHNKHFFRNINLINYKTTLINNAHGIYTVSDKSFYNIELSGFKSSLVYGNSHFNSGLSLHMNYVDNRTIENITIPYSLSADTEYDVILYQGDMNQIRGCVGGKYKFDQVYASTITSSYFEKCLVMHSHIDFINMLSEKFTPYIIFRSNCKFTGCSFGAYNRNISNVNIGGLPFIKVVDTNATDYISSSAIVGQSIQRSNIILDNVRFNLNGSYHKTSDIKDIITDGCNITMKQVYYTHDAYGSSFSVHLPPTIDKDLKLQDFTGTEVREFINNFNSSVDLFSTALDGFYPQLGVTDSDNYYYKGHFLIDAKRRIGLTRLYEPNIIGNTTRKDIMIDISKTVFQHINNPFYLELFRGATTGSYDKKVLVPILGDNTSTYSNKIFDLGDNISNNFFWENRTAGTYDAINEVFTKVIYNGNNCTIFTTTLPTVGLWEYGDNCILSNGDIYIMVNPAIITWTKLN